MNSLKYMKKIGLLVSVCVVLTACSIVSGHSADNITDPAISTTELPANEKIEIAHRDKDANKDANKDISKDTNKDTDKDTNKDTSKDTNKGNNTNKDKDKDTDIDRDIVQNADLERAHQILEDMSLEEKVGQMFIVRHPLENAAQLAAKYHLGGYILFGRDFKDKTKEDITREINTYQEVSEIDMLIGVDEEGGIVNRISLYKPFRAVPFWSPQDLYNEGGWDLIVSDTKEKATLLKSMGINLNLAPVSDVSTNPSDYMYPRSFGKNAELTAQYVEKVVTTMNENEIGSVLKHFPGYGNNKDTHTGIAYDHRSYENFVESDFIPFEAGIHEGAGSVLVSHNIVKSMDSEYPASLSPKIHQILREDLNFEGVIMTDDLYMDAIGNYTDSSAAAVMAVLAGNDMLCCTDFEIQIPAVIQAVKEGKISEDTIDESVIRILRWKLELGVIE